jgi:hypothetical protein
MQIGIEKYRVLTADEGMVLTNGETYGTTVLLPEGADAAVWREVTEAEAQQAIMTQED